MTKQKLSLLLLFIPYILLSQMIYVDKMEVNELNSPIGLDDQNPSFSWKINCDCYNLKQTHYQIKVSSDKFDSKENLIWDSGKIESSNSIRIRYDGSSLKYDTDYYWQITIWTNKNNMENTHQDISLYDIVSSIISAKKRASDKDVPVLLKKQLLALLLLRYFQTKNMTNY